MFLWPQEWMMKMINEKQVGTTLEKDVIKKIDRIRKKLDDKIININRSKIVSAIVTRVLKDDEDELVKKIEVWVNENEN